MKTKIVYGTAFVIFTLLLQSCFTPKNIIKLQPSAENTKWTYGQEFAKDSINGIIYQVGFDQVIEPNYLFDFDITNRSNMPILIDPKDFYYLPLDENKQPLTEEKFYAKDPETTILEIEKDLSMAEARRKNNTVLSLIALGVDIATNVAVNTDHNPHNDFVRTDLFWGVQEANRINEFEAADLSELHKSWSSSTIRKTTLEPAYSMKGKVFFPSFAQASYIQLFMPVDDRLVQILFQQKLIPVNR